MKRLVSLGVGGLVLCTSLVSGQAPTPQDLRKELLAILDDEPRAKYPGKTSCATWTAARREGTGADATFIADIVVPWVQGYFTGAFDLGFHLAVVLQLAEDPAAKATLSRGLDTVTKLPAPETIPQRIDTYCQAYPDNNMHRMAIELLKGGYPRPGQ